eukprot:5539159-Prymnesium_polylepis.1
MAGDNLHRSKTRCRYMLLTCSPPFTGAALLPSSPRTHSCKQRRCTAPHGPHLSQSMVDIRTGVEEEPTEGGMQRCSSHKQRRMAIRPASVNVRPGLEQEPRALLMPVLARHDERGRPAVDSRVQIARIVLKQPRQRVCITLAGHAHDQLGRLCPLAERVSE